MTALDTLRGRLEAGQNDARLVYEADKGTPARDFAAGRYDGLKQAIEILDDIIIFDNTTSRREKGNACHTRS